MDADHTLRLRSQHRGLLGALVGAVFACALPASAHGAEDAQARAVGRRIGLVDASRVGKAVVVYGADRAALGRSGAAMRYLRLAPPAAGQIECCLRVSGAAKPSHDLAVESSANATSGHYAMATLSRRPALGFFGLALGGSRPTAEPQPDRSVLLSWPDQPMRPVRVQHCVSTESLHVRIVDAVTSVELLRYALPLGMDVEADCNDGVMPPRK